MGRKKRVNTSKRKRWRKNKSRRQSKDETPSFLCPKCDQALSFASGKGICPDCQKITTPVRYRERRNLTTDQCPDCNGELHRYGTCKLCPNCGWSSCFV